MLEFRVFQSIQDGSERYAWFNRFVFRTDSTSGSPNSRLLAIRIMNFMRAITLETVHIDSCMIYEFMHVFAGTEDKTGVIVSPGFTYASEPRTLQTACPPYVALQFQKQMQTGKSGHFWFFHSLNLEEVFRGRDGQLTLKTAREWEQITEFWWKNSVEKTDGFTLVSSPRSGLDLVAASRNVVSLTVGFPVQARNRERMRHKANPQLANILQYAQIIAEKTATTEANLQSWEAFNEDFVPDTMRTDVVTAIADIHGVAEQIKAYAASLGDSKKTGKKPPLKRWGTGWETFAGWCKSTTGELDYDIKQLLILQPYRFVDRGMYFTHDDLKDAMDVFDKYRHWLAAYHSFDWLTPYEDTGDTDTKSTTYEGQK